MHRWGYYSARSLHLHKKKVLSSLWNTSLVGLNRKKEIISFPEVHQNLGKPGFCFSWPCDLGVKFRQTASLRVLDLLKYSPSTHEGRFLVVPATLPGRQEHFTVCDRSSMRFLLQHLWAAITSHVPPSDKGEEAGEKSKSQRRSNRPVLLVLRVKLHLSYRHIFNHCYSSCPNCMATIQ